MLRHPYYYYYYRRRVLFLLLLLLLILLLSNLYFRPVIQTATSLVNVLNKTCPACGCLSSTVFFFNPQGSFFAITLQSHPFHPSAALAPVIMVPLGCVPAASPVHICTSSPLSSCPSSAVLSAISRSGIIECHFQPPEVMQQRWYLTEHSAHCCCHSNRENLGNVLKSHKKNESVVGWGWKRIQCARRPHDIVCVVYRGRYRIARMGIIINRGPHIQKTS